MAAKRKILLAFTGLPLAGEIFKLACLFVRESAAELDLMRIHLPEDEQTAGVDGEQLYSELKTVAAQLQERGIAARLRAEPGRGETPILNYLARHSVDLLIVVGQKGREGARDDDLDQLMHTMLRQAPCPTLMVA